jgi:hypothetical protein
LRRAPAALFFLVPLLALAPVLAGRAQFFYRDVTRQYAPLQAQLELAWQQGELPLWNASTQSGVPLFANLHAGVLAPWQPIFRALDFHRAYGLSVALAWTALMLGLFVFLRSRVGAAASTVGALAGGLTGVVLGATSYLPLLGGVACIPWQLVALAQERGLVRVSVLGALFALQVLMGDPSTALMGGFACLLASATDPRPGALRDLLLGVLVALGLSAVQWIPGWTLFEESARASSTLEARLAWSFHPARTLEWLVRLPFGELLAPPYFTRSELAAGPDAQPFFLEHGWGLLPLLMLGPAVVTRGPLRRLGLGLLLVGFGLSLGSHLGPLQGLFALPPLSLFRFPERYAALTALGVALLTAQGAGALIEGTQPRFRWALGWAGLSAIFAASALLAPEPTARALLITAGLLGGTAALSLTLAGVRWAWVLIVLSLGALDGARAVRASVLTLPAEELVRTLELGTRRVWRENAPLRALETPVRGSEGFGAERRLLHTTFASATPGLHGASELGGYSPVAVRRWQRVLQVAARRPALLAQLFDVGWFVSTRERVSSNPDWTAVAEVAPQIWLAQSSSALGRAWSVPRVLAVTDTDAALSALSSPLFDAAQVATREDGAPLPALAHTTVTLAPRRLASEIQLSVEPREQWVMVVISESWAPGWRGWVDGSEQPVELLDGALLGIAVPPGGRAIQLRYEEPLGTTGLAFSAATAMALFLFWLRSRRRSDVPA